MKVPLRKKDSLGGFRFLKNIKQLKMKKLESLSETVWCYNGLDLYEMVWSSVLQGFDVKISFKMKIPKSLSLESFFKLLVKLFQGCEEVKVV